MEEQYEIDSLNAILNNPGSHDTSIASAYIGLSSFLYLTNPDSNFYVCIKAKEIAENALINNPPTTIKQSLTKSLANAISNLGMVYDSKGDIPKALDYFFEALKLQEESGNKVGIATALNNIGYIFDKKGDIPKALEYYHQSLKIYEEVGDKDGIAQSFNNIGMIYNNQGDNSKAIEYYNKSLTIREEIADRDGIAESLNNIGYGYYFLAYDSEDSVRDSLLNIAIIYFKKSLKIEEEMGNKNGMAVSLNNIGVINYKKGDLIEAKEFHIKSLNLKKELEDKDGIVYSLINIATIEFEMGNLREATNYAMKSLKLAEELGFPSTIRKAAKLLSDIYEKQNKGMQSLEMHKLYISMRDSINNEETQRATAQQQAKYEYEKQKVIDDAKHDKLIAIEKEEKEKQQIITATTAGGLGLVMVFLFFVYNRLKITRKQKMVIEEQKEKVEKQRDLIENAHKEITDSIDYAKRIQSAILPPPRIVKEYLEDSFIIYTPKDVVAGDFYWMRHKDEKILFAAADCTGHGVPGAMVSVVCNMALNRSVREYGLTDPGEILDKTRSIVVREFEKSDEEVKDGMDIALCTLEGNKLQYAGAYNPLWIIRKGEIMETKADRWPIGLTRDPQPYTTHSIDLEKGDLIYIFTDGFVDQFGGEKGKKMKTKRFKELLLSIQKKSMDDQRSFIKDFFFDWMGNLEQVDDVCLIGVKV